MEVAGQWLGGLRMKHPHLRSQAGPAQAQARRLLFAAPPVDGTILRATHACRTRWQDGARMPPAALPQGVMHVLLGQREGSAEHMKHAEQAFQVSTPQCPLTMCRDVLHPCASAAVSVPPSAKASSSSLFSTPQACIVPLPMMPDFLQCLLLLVPAFLARTPLFPTARHAMRPLPRMPDRRLVNGRVRHDPGPPGDGVLLLPAAALGRRAGVPGGAVGWGAG